MSAWTARLRSPTTVVGALVGLAVAAAFLVAHAILVEPIWIDGLKGIPVAVAAGIVAAHALLRALPHLPAPPAWGGVVFGILAGILAPAVAQVGLVRDAGAPPAAWLGLLAAVGLLWLAVARVAVAREAFTPLVVAASVASAMPVVFLLFTRDLTGLDRAPSPFPIASALFALVVAAGAVLGAVLAAQAEATDERAAPGPDALK